MKNPAATQSASQPPVQLTDLARHAPVGPTAVSSKSQPLDDAPSYGYGTQIDLGPEELDAMNLASTPTVGQRVGISANAHVKAHSMDEQGKHRVTLQLTHAGIHAPHAMPKGAKKSVKTLKEGTAAEERGESAKAEAVEKASGKGDAIKVSAHVRRIPSSKGK